MLWGRRPRRGSFSSQSSLSLFLITTFFLDNYSDNRNFKISYRCSQPTSSWHSSSVQSHGVRLKVHVRLTELRNSWSPAYWTSPPQSPDVPEDVCKPTSEWDPRLHNHSVCKGWSLGWARVILVAIGDVSAESEPSVYLGGMPALVLFSDCPQGYLFMLRELSSWSKDFSIEPDEPFYMKRTPEISGTTRARWMTACRHVADGASRGPDKVTAQCPQSSSVLREASSLLTGLLLHVPTMWDNSTSWKPRSF